MKLKNQPTSSCLSSKPCLPGFALIATISVMVLLIMVALAMMSLSVIETRSVRNGDAMQEARNNARLALMVAIGELQSLTGQDTRITATSEATAEVNGSPYVTGVWRSWEGNNHNKSTGLPVVPDYGSKLQTGDTDPISTNTGRFLGWLLSGSEKDNDAKTAPSLAEIDGDTVPLLAQGTLGTTADSSEEVHLVPTDIGDEGAYAWWVQGLNTKALIEQAEPDPNDDEFSKWANRQNANPQYNSESFGISDSEELAKLVSFGAFDLVDPTGAEDVATIAVENYHSLTHYSRGLLTNASTGGWKRDLSLLAEKWAPGNFPYKADNPDYRVPWGTTVPESGFSTFNLSPGVSNDAGLKTEDSGDDAMLYGWTTASSKASMTWNSLADFASLYKNLQQDGNGNHYYRFYNSLAPNANNNAAMTGERFSIIEPMIVRWQTILSLASEKIGSLPNVNYVPLVGVHPSVTYYNPYNVTIDSTGYIHDYLQIDWNAFPIKLTFQIGSGSSVKPWKMPLLMGMNYAKNHENRWNVRPKISSLEDQMWKPGECRVLGRPALSGITGGGGTIDINTGMDDRPYFRRIRNTLSTADQAEISEDGYEGSLPFKISWERYAHSGTVPGWLRTGTSRVSYGRSLPFHVSTDPDQIDGKSPVNQTDTSVTETLSDIVWNEDKFEPFLSMALSKRNLFNSYAASKGYINNKLILPPSLDSGEGIEKSSFEWKIDRLNGQVDPNTTNYNDSLSAGGDVSGFVGTSFASNQGLARWVTAELPTQPLLSICELQHFDPAFINPRAPRVANALGNSHATPFIQNNEIQIAGTVGYDHSYAFNHIMFDDWFASSISPELEPFSANVISDRKIDDVLAEFFTGEESLKNSAYLPAELLSESTVSEYIKDTYKDSGTSWTKVAADLEVKGMFNVNSTSVEAWKAILKNTKGGKVPHQTINTSMVGRWNMEQGPAYNSPISRTSTVGDALSAGNDAQLLAQPLDWTDKQLDALADEIVKQIKLRGPFLSLSEFINRQLTTDENLAMAGAVESALIVLSEYGAGDVKNPYGEILSAFPENEMESYVDEDGNTVTYPKYRAREFSDHQNYYEFPKAAEGHVAYGTPGWTRQADILRPIAPILSVRDDSFTVRCYGASKDITGNIVAEAWCEATVKRTAEYVDQTNEKNDYTNLSEVNKSFGRRFEIVSFRWLGKEEL